MRHGFLMALRNFKDLHNLHYITATATTITMKTTTIKTISTVTITYTMLKACIYHK